MALSPVQMFFTLAVLCCAFISSGEALRVSRRAPVPRTAITSFTITLTNGSMSLPSPASGLTLQAIGLGRGIQNYTCSSSSATATPVSIGAVATLYDATQILPSASASQEQQGLNFLSTYLVDVPSTVLAASGLPVLGQHYFDTTGTATFDLGSTGLLKGAKVGDIAAPSSASKGAMDQGYGAVDWLALTAKAGMVSTNLGEVYRLQTAGGKPAVTCDGQSTTIEVQYSAQYWFYG